MRTASRTLSRYVIASVILIAVALLATGFMSWTRSTSSPLLEVVVDLGPYESLAAAEIAADDIDWSGQDEGEQQAAVTLGWAAQELQTWLSRAGIDVRVTVGDAPVLGEQFVRLTVLPLPDQRPALGDQGFDLHSEKGNVSIQGNTRVGVLYGVYHYLDSVGFRWWSPEEWDVPRITDPAELQVAPTREVPETRLRGFWIPMKGELLEDSYAIWMARNRLNLGGPIRESLRKKLGVYSWNGGHRLLQEMLSRTQVFERHPDFYGSLEGERQPVRPGTTGNFFNPSFANPRLAGFVARNLVGRLSGGELRNVDIVALWPSEGFDNWDESPDARAIGNHTDTLLHFYSNVLDHFEKAYQKGNLERPISISGISFNDTWELPSKPAHYKELANRDYVHVFYDPERSFHGSISDSRATSSRRLIRRLSDWKRMGDVAFGITEYFNNSNYAAVPITDHLYMRENFATQMSGGGDLYAYMHPLQEGGPRTLTDWLLGRLAWRGASTSEAEYESWVKDYFEGRYSEVADQVRGAYVQIAHGVENAREMFLRNSLFDLLFLQHRLERGYSAREVSALLDGYLLGGWQDIPPSPKVGLGRYDGFPLERAEFRGLDESLSLLEDAVSALENVDASSSATVRERVEEDLAWATAAASRYKLFRNAIGYYRGYNLPDLFPADERRLPQYRQTIIRLNRELSSTKLIHQPISSLIDQTRFYLPPEYLRVGRAE